MVTTRFSLRLQEVKNRQACKKQLTETTYSRSSRSCHPKATKVRNSNRTVVGKGDGQKVEGKKTLAICQKTQEKLHELSKVNAEKVKQFQVKLLKDQPNLGNAALIEEVSNYREGLEQKTQIPITKAALKQLGKWPIKVPKGLRIKPGLKLTPRQELEVEISLLRTCTSLLVGMINVGTFDPNKVFMDTAQIKKCHNRNRELFGSGGGGICKRCAWKQDENWQMANMDFADTLVCQTIIHKGEQEQEVPHSCPDLRPGASKEIQCVRVESMKSEPSPALSDSEVKEEIGRMGLGPSVPLNEQDEAFLKNKLEPPTDPEVVCQVLLDPVGRIIATIVRNQNYKSCIMNQSEREKVFGGTSEGKYFSRTISDAVRNRFNHLQPSDLEASRGSGFGVYHIYFAGARAIRYPQGRGITINKFARDQFREVDALFNDLSIFARGVEERLAVCSPHYHDYYRNKVHARTEIKRAIARGHPVIPCYGGIAVNVPTEEYRESGKTAPGATLDAHLDTGDANFGLCFITSYLSNRPTSSGEKRRRNRRPSISSKSANLVLPQFQARIVSQAGDSIMFCSREFIHYNTPLIPGDSMRGSLVCFNRESIHAYYSAGRRFLKELGGAELARVRHQMSLELKNREQICLNCLPVGRKDEKLSDVRKAARQQKREEVAKYREVLETSK